MILIAGEYFAQLFYSAEAPQWTAKGLAVGLNTIVLLINCRDNKWGTRLQDYTTFIKLIALVMIGIIGFVVLGRDGGKVDTPVQHNLSPENAFPAQKVSIGHFGLAVVGALFGYDGWNNA
jgi:amino acid transporter